MGDSLRMTGNGVEVDLYPWLRGKAKGMQALAGILGFGLPGVTNQWFDGVSGSSWRGSRVGRRKITLPLRVFAADRAELWDLIGDLSVLLDPLVAASRGNRDGAARLFFGAPDDSEWYLDVVRDSGGDWSRKTDSDDRTYFQTSIVLEAGDAFWTRVEPEQFEIDSKSNGNTFLPKLARTRVGSTATMGSREVVNIGNTTAWPIITLSGPGESVLLIGPNGERLKWTDLPEAGRLGSDLIINMRDNTIETAEGKNLYTGLDLAPRFWSIAPGRSQVTVQVEGVTSETLLVAQWWPRRWAVV